jgi:hypothetical protein
MAEHRHPRPHVQDLRLAPSVRVRLRSVDVARHFGVSDQRVSQMVVEGKLRLPDAISGRSVLEPERDRAVGRTPLVGEETWADSVNGVKGRRSVAWRRIHSRKPLKEGAGCLMAHPRSAVPTFDLTARSADAPTRRTDNRRCGRWSFATADR